MVYDPAVDYPETTDLLSRLDVCTRSLVSFDALSAAQVLFGDTAVANFLLIGAAYQQGALPIPAAAIEEAIQINGVVVAANVAAFRWGRVAVADPAAFAKATTVINSVAGQHSAVVAHLLCDTAMTGEVREVLQRRCADLVAYQGKRHAKRLAALAERTWAAERSVTERTDLSEAVVTNFFRLLAYKDEYEVARLLTDPAFTEVVSAQVPGARKMTYKLHPPMLKSLGRKKKIGLGPRSHFALRLLAKGRFLRGHSLDPFGHTRMRRLERKLIDHYEAMIDTLIESLTAESYDTAVAAARAADIVRGYEEVKLANVDRYVNALNDIGIAAPDLP
jgi:indolepyruvate ferredoxin oxidoreductase